MQLYCLKILLTIPFCNMIPCLFQLNFVFFLPAYIFFSSLIPRFSCFTPSKRTQNSFRTIRPILDVLFILIFISIVIYTVYTSLFALSCLYLFTLTYLYRNSHPEVFLRKGVIKICSKFTGEHPCRSVISIKLHSNFIEITLRHECSLVNLLYIFRTPFSKNTSGRLLLFILVFSLYYYMKLRKLIKFGKYRNNDEMF